MGIQHANTSRTKKKRRTVDRDLTTALFLLRCTQLGISIADLEYLTVGMIMDMFMEKELDEEEVKYKATQTDIDNLLR